MVTTSSTKTLREQLAQLDVPAFYATENESLDNKVVKARLFCLGSAATWLVCEFDPDDLLIFGYADLYGSGEAGGAEWGYSSVEELESLKWHGIPRVELDVNFTPKPFRDCVRDDGSIL